MATPGCHTEQCTFTGPESDARPGRCTGTPGYLANVEIREIVGSGKFSIEEFYSQEAGDILVYGGTEWVLVSPCTPGTPTKVIESTY